MSGVVQPGYAPPTGPDQPAAPRRRRWLLVVVVAWAVLLAALTWLSVRDDPPTVREQRSLDQAGPVVDRAVGELVAAGGSTAVMFPPQVDRGCRVTPFTDGARLLRHVDVFVAEGAERELLERVADRLPGGWRAGVRASADGPLLRADAGEFVAVEGTAEENGRVRLTADTGCRPYGTGYREQPPGAPGTEGEALAGALRALGGPTAPAVERVTAPCPGGAATAHSVRAVAGPAPQSPAAALRALAGGAPLLDTPQAYAYRAGAATVVADLTGDPPVLTASTGCPA
ncbi:hypothetical protein ACIBXA_01225 [Micromonospora echinaurantiaca]|uniref:hypothetical protein n=1 Tax=Micromonospora TaxID=1873 RepID=UPI000D6F9E9B|nr:hypothetical protein [Micromonospora sp. S4605]PWU58105.1 hypothetical protein DLJ47_00355 [Micromonospora sp. S4605]